MWDASYSFRCLASSSILSSRQEMGWNSKRSDWVRIWRPAELSPQPFHRLQDPGADRRCAIRPEGKARRHKFWRGGQDTQLQVQLRVKFPHHLEAGPGHETGLVFAEKDR